MKTYWEKFVSIIIETIIIVQYDHNDLKVMRMSGNFELLHQRSSVEVMDEVT